MSSEWMMFNYCVTLMICHVDMYTQYYFRFKCNVDGNIFAINMRRLNKTMFLETVIFVTNESNNSGSVQLQWTRNFFSWYTAGQLKKFLPPYIQHIEELWRIRFAMMTEWRTNVFIGLNGAFHFINSLRNSTK